MKGVRRIVIFRSRSLGRVRVAMTAGTVQPKPTRSGTMLRPESPSLRRSLSMTNATRAMYPLSSRIERKKNRVTMIGRKLSTDPTPPITPSMRRLCRVSLTFAAVSVRSTVSARDSIPLSRRSCNNAPITPKVSQKTSPMITMNAGIAVYRPVRILSIFSLRRRSRLSFGLVTVSRQTLPMKSKRMSATAALRSRPDSFSICKMICSTVSVSFRSSFN